MKKILLIEDNTDHADILKLKIPAYVPEVQVVQFSTLAHARLAWQQSKEEFMAVIIDLTLPDSDRRETIDFINAVQHSAPLIIYSGVEIAATDIIDKAVYFVQKPDRASRLIAILNEIIAGVHSEWN